MFYPSQDGFKENLLESKKLLRVFQVILVNITDSVNKMQKTLTVTKPMLNNSSKLNEKTIFEYSFQNWSDYEDKMAVIRKNVKILPELYSDKLQKGLVLNYAAFTYGTYVNLGKKL